MAILRIPVHIDYNELVDRLSVESIKNIITELSNLREEGNGDFRGRCPFPYHPDRNPSFLITANQDFKGVWVCSCGSGSIISFVANTLDISKDNAANYLYQFIDKELEVEDEIDNIIYNFEEDNQHDSNIRLPKNRINRSVIRDYLVTKRRYKECDADEIIEYFRLTTCVDPKLPHIENWIIIPVFDRNKNLVMWMGQNPHSRDKYNRGNSSGVLFGIDHAFSYGAGFLHKRKPCFIVESVWCAMKLWLWGWDFPLATMGARLDKHQAKLISENFGDVFLCYDNDQAGKKAEKKAIERLYPQCYVHIIEMPKDKDPDKCSKEEFDSIMSSCKLYVPV